MNLSERDIAFSHDLDGVHFIFAPPPVNTALMLVRGRFELPPPLSGPPNGEFCDTPLIRFGNKMASIIHGSRPVRPGSVQTINGINEIAANTGRVVDHYILSGRGPSLHQMTQSRLRQVGLLELMTDTLLNQSKSSSGWKEWQIRQLLGKGYRTTVHVDDDLKPVLRIARLSDNSLCYLMKNLSNSPILLRRAGINLPRNVIMISGFSDLLADFDDKLRLGLI